MAGANNILHGYDARLGEDVDVVKATLKAEEEEGTSQSPSRKKQKRNKPTLRYLPDCQVQKHC